MTCWYYDASLVWADQFTKLAGFFFSSGFTKELAKHSLCILNFWEISYCRHKQWSTLEHYFVCSSSVTGRNSMHFLQAACITKNLHIDTPIWMICHSKYIMGFDNARVLRIKDIVSHLSPVKVRMMMMMVFPLPRVLVCGVSYTHSHNHHHHHHL